MVCFRSCLAAVTVLTFLVASAQALTWEKLGRVPGDTTAMAPAPKGGGFYIASRLGGRRECGEIRLLAARRSRPVFAFNGYNGKAPIALKSIGRTVYGIAAEGGRHGKGVLFRLRRGGIQILRHFDETTGAPEQLNASGRTLYGVCNNGAFRTRGGGDFGFAEIAFPSASAVVDGTLFVSDYLYGSPGIYRVGVSGPEKVVTPFPKTIVSSRSRILGVLGRYEGRYGYGSVVWYEPATGRRGTIVEFQSYNGGGPRTPAVTRNGTLYTTNDSGIWRVAAQPRKILPWGDVSLLFSDGRRLFGVRGSYFRRTGFVVKP